MFGHDDKPKDDEAHEDNGPALEHTEKVIAPDDHTSNDSSDDSSWQHPGTPLKDDSQDDQTDSFTAGQTATTDEPSDASDNQAPSAPFSTTADAGPEPASDNSNHDLIDIKQEALGKLSPLIGHLDQTPDEKFRTLMMMIQASDDQSLVKQAYETALDITDEKARAQALLDIVNEINYFTQNPSKSE
jgi:hypothetical protein